MTYFAGGMRRRPTFTHFNRTPEEKPLMSNDAKVGETQSEPITAVAEDITFDTIIEDEDGEADLPRPDGAEEEPDDPDKEETPTVPDDEDNAPD